MLFVNYEGHIVEKMTHVEYAHIAGELTEMRYDMERGRASAYTKKGYLITYVIFNPYGIEEMDLEKWLRYVRPLIWSKVRKVYIGEVTYDLNYAINIRGRKMSEVIGRDLANHDYVINFRFSTVLAKDNNYKEWTKQL